jgi:hypothetical protein
VFNVVSAIFALSIKHLCEILRDSDVVANQISSLELWVRMGQRELGNDDLSCHIALGLFTFSAYALLDAVAAVFV